MRRTDAGLLPGQMFTRMLEQARHASAEFVDLAGELCCGRCRTWEGSRPTVARRSSWAGSRQVTSATGWCDRRGRNTGRPTGLTQSGMGYRAVR